MHVYGRACKGGPVDFIEGISYVHQSPGGPQEVAVHQLSRSVHSQFSTPRSTPSTKQMMSMISANRVPPFQKQNPSKHGRRASLQAHTSSAWSCDVNEVVGTRVSSISTYVKMHFIEHRLVSEDVDQGNANKLKKVIRNGIMEAISLLWST